MANENSGSLLQRNAVDANFKKAVVYYRNHVEDSGVRKAVAQAGMEGCSIIMRKHEKYFRYGEGDIEVDAKLCFTDDPGITAEYEQAGKQVIQIEPLTPEELAARDPVALKRREQEEIEARRNIENVHLNTQAVAENEALRKQMAKMQEQLASLTAKSASEVVAKPEQPAGDAVKSPEAAQEGTHKKKQTLGINKQSGSRPTPART